MKKKKPSKKKPKVDPALEGFDIDINELGEIKNDYDLEQLLKFLDEQVDDKKLRNSEKKKEKKRKKRKK